MLLGQKDHADPIFAGRRQFDAQGRRLSPVVLVGYLDQDPGTVAHQLVRADGAPMVQVLEDQQALRNDLMRPMPLDVRDEADTAGIMLASRRVHPVLAGVGD
jgi:hypothetical protein